MKTLAVGTRLERHREFMKQYKEMKERLEAEKTPEQKAKEKSELAKVKARAMERLKLIRARKALKPVNEKAEPVKSEPKKYMPSKITSAWTAFVFEKGGVQEAAAAKRADNKAYLAFAEKWKKDNS